MVVWPGRVRPKDKLEEASLRIEGAEAINFDIHTRARRWVSLAGGQATDDLAPSCACARMAGVDRPWLGLLASRSREDNHRLPPGPQLLGADPAQPEELWERMNRLTQWYGRKERLISALGAPDAASGTSALRRQACPCEDAWCRVRECRPTRVHCGKDDSQALRVEAKSS